MADYPTSDPTIASLHTAVNNLSTALDGAINDVVTTITVLDTTGFPTVGAVTIEAERISYTGKTGTTFTGCTRGFGGTNAVSHVDTTPVKQTYGAEYHNDMRDEVIAMADDLIDVIDNDLNDGVAPAATAPDVRNRMNHIATQLKNITGEADWKTVPTNKLNTAVQLTGNESINGIKTFIGQLIGKGTITNDDATSGQIGESISATIGATAFPATGVVGDATSISLTAGDWLVSVTGQVSATDDLVTDASIGASITPGNSFTGLVTGDTFIRTGGVPKNTGSIRGPAAIPNMRFSLAGTTTVYLKYVAGYTGNIPNMQGARIQAVRIR